MRFLIAVPLAMLAVPALAQPSPGGGGAAAQDPVADEELKAVGNEILVIGARLRGQVDAPQPPVLTLDEGDIAAYGAVSLDELITLLAPETGSGRGRGGGAPVFLLNGVRISSFRELRDIPPEAIRRLEVLPEEVALRYGYAPNQRVVNFILKDNFAGKSLFGEFFEPGRGGFASSGARASLLRISGPSRLNLSARFNGTTLLTENERNVIQSPSSLPTVAGDPDPASARSLIASHREYVANGTWATGLGEKGLAGSLSINGTFTHTDDTSLAGLNTVVLTAPGGVTARRTFGDPLARLTSSDAAQLGATLNRALGAWQLTATLDSSYTQSKTRIDRRVDTSALIAAAAAGSLAITGPLPALVPAGADTADQRDLALSSLVTLVGHPLRMPAGDALLTVRAGYSYADTRSSDTRTGFGALTLKRGDLAAGVNLALPLTSRREDVLPGIGNLTLNLSAGYDRLSDVGSLTDWSAGLTWNVTARLGLQASYIVNQAAPTLTQLGAPTIQSFNVPVFDFSTSRNTLVTVISGGNPALAKEKQRDVKLSANWQLPFFQRSNLIVEYFRNRSSDVSEPFPLLTPAIEAAFPARVARDAAGNLVSIDQRPVTFSAEQSSRLRWGLNLSGRLGPDPRAAGDAAGPGGMAGPPGFGGGGRGMGSRWNLGLYHTVRFTDLVTIAPGGPALDLLGGDAIVSGGVPRHSFELEGGAFVSGIGLRLNGTWNAPVHLSASGAPGSSDLRFGSVFDVDLRLFVDLGRQESLVDKVPFFQGARLSARVTNLFASRQKVTDASGAVPLAYQPDYLDPRGRMFGIDFRKMF